MSRPTWARGLKPNSSYSYQLSTLSRPTWARGLKQMVVPSFARVKGRAPRGRVD